MLGRIRHFMNCYGVCVWKLRGIETTAWKGTVEKVGSAERGEKMTRIRKVMRENMYSDLIVICYAIK